MELKNCKWCGRVFAHSMDDICLSCRQQEEEDFSAVHAYLQEKKKATIEEVNQATGVERHRIIKFIRQGRFAAEGDFSIFVECESCGDLIKEGRLCEKCSQALKDEVRAAQKKEKPKRVRDKEKKSRMHIADRLKKQK